MGAYENRAELIKTAIFQTLGEKSDERIKLEYTLELREIAESGVMPQSYTTASLKKVADFLFEDVKRFNNHEESLEKVDKVIYQPSLEQIRNLISETYSQEIASQKVESN